MITIDNTSHASHNDGGKMIFNGGIDNNGVAGLSAKNLEKKFNNNGGSKNLLDL